MRLAPDQPLALREVGAIGELRLVALSPFGGGDARAKGGRRVEDRVGESERREDSLARFGNVIAERVPEQDEVEVGVDHAGSALVLRPFLQQRGDRVVVRVERHPRAQAAGVREQFADGVAVNALVEVEFVQGECRRNQRFGQRRAVVDRLQRRRKAQRHRDGVTQRTFPAALTAVVGPNGCGKSNICDALIWVLGENRASHIRGETMDDVIFQGSARRRPLSMGEVTLTLAATNGDSNNPAADDGRITINRRVFRTGESEFRLNGKRVRLKDISDILMDTGLGIRNYSVMEQGKIDLILSNKPQDRRKLIEEAAGITKYKTKRRAAELKLEETQQNLLRIDDTLGEVTRNLNSLKRQAGKARKHKELIDELSTAKRALYKGRIVVAEAEQRKADQGVGAAQAGESELVAQLANDEAALVENRTALAGASSRASRLREEIASLTGEVE